MVKKVFVSVLILIFLSITVFLGITSFKSNQKTIEHDGLIRNYRVHLPTGYTPNKSYPLVVAMHGISQDGRTMELLTGFSRKADAEGFIVVYPSGHKFGRFSPVSWNSGFCCGLAFENEVDDIGYISKLIDVLPGMYSVDSSKIYLVGYSNGGMLTHAVAARLGEKISASAMVSASVGGKFEDEEEYRSIEKSSVPVSTLILHGKNDAAVPFNGGSNGLDVFEYAGAYDSVSFWLDNNECARHPAEISKQDLFTKEVYGSCKDEKEVVFYALETNHVWPGGLLELTKNISGRSVSATDLVWEFLSAH